MVVIHAPWVDLITEKGEGWAGIFLSSHLKKFAKHNAMFKKHLPASALRFKRQIFSVLGLL